MAHGSSNPSTDLKKVAGTVVDTNTGNASAGTQRVVLATNQPAVAVTGTFYQATQPVSGTVTINAIPNGTNTIGNIGTVSTVTNLSQLGGTAISMNTGVRDAGTQRVTIATNDVVPVTGTFYQATQPVSGPLTDTQLRASAVPVSLASLPSLATGTNSIGNIATVSTVTNLSQLGGTAISMNTGVRDAGTQRVTIATNDVVPVTGTFYQATQPVSGTVTVLQATAANLNATVTGTVELGATSLAALENISVTVPGTVDLGTVSLTALETITVTSGTPNNFQSKVYGAVTTAAPAYTNATDNALSLTTSGALRVDGSAVTQPVSGTFWQATQPVSGPLTDTQLRATAVPVSLASLPALATGTNAIGSITNTSFASTQSGTWTVGLSASQTLGTVTTVSTVTNLSQLGGTAISMNTGVRDAGTQRVTIATNDSVPVTGTFYQATQPVSIAASVAVTGPLTDTQLRATAVPVSLASLPALTTGSASIGTVVLTAETTKVIGTVNVAASQSIAVTQATPANLQVSATQIVGTAATRWYTQLSDGTNSPAIKAASIAAVATDPALVVAISPNNTVGLSAGTNAIGKLAANAGVTIGAVEIAATQTLGAVTTVSTVTNLSQLGGAAITMGTGVRAAGTLRVTIATDDVVQTAATPQNTAAYAPSNATTTVYATSLVIKASAGTLYAITGYNSKISAQFVQVHNATALPANTAVPVLIFTVPASSNFSLDLTPYGRYFTTGITVCNSSTGPTLTVGAADCWFDAQYK